MFLLNGLPHLQLLRRLRGHRRRLVMLPKWSMSDPYENDMALLEFNNTNIANVGDGTGLRGSSAAGSWYLSGHTADPGEAGTQASSEATYTGYSRTAVARSGAGFTVTNNQAVNAATISLGACTAGSNTLTHWGLGVASSGATRLAYYGPIIASGALWYPFTSIVAGNVITVPTGSFSVDDRICFAPAYSSVLPGNITAGTVYWVKTVSGNDITIAATQGGAAIVMAVGSGVCIKCQPIAVSASITPQFAAGALVLSKD